MCREGRRSPPVDRGEATREVPPPPHPPSPTAPPLPATPRRRRGRHRGNRPSMPPPMIAPPPRWRWRQHRRRRRRWLPRPPRHPRQHCRCRRRLAVRHRTAPDPRVPSVRPAQRRTASVPAAILVSVPRPLRFRTRRASRCPCRRTPGKLLEPSRLHWRVAVRRPLAVMFPCGQEPCLSPQPLVHPKWQGTPSSLWPTRPA